MKRVKVSAPGKLMLYGEHGVIYGESCIVAAVDKRVEVEVERVKGESVEIVIPKRVNDLSYVQAVLAVFKKRQKVGGVRILTKNSFSTQYGFGSSAAVTVALVKALFELRKVAINREELFKFCYQVVVEVQGLGSGFDIASAIYGGVVYFVTGGKKIEKLKVKGLPIVVGYTGVKADTAMIVRRVAKLRQQNKGKVEKVFKEIGGIVEQAKRWLPEDKWEELGELMSENQRLLSQLGVSSDKLDRMITAAGRVGAFGAKLSGAGEGDCMMALHHDGIQGKQLVEEAIRRAGGEVVKVRLGAAGVRVEA